MYGHIKFYYHGVSNEPKSVACYNYWLDASCNMWLIIVCNIRTYILRWHHLMTKKQSIHCSQLPTIRSIIWTAQRGHNLQLMLILITNTHDKFMLKFTYFIVIIMIIIAFRYLWTMLNNFILFTPEKSPMAW